MWTKKLKVPSPNKDISRERYTHTSTHLTDILMKNLWSRRHFLYAKRILRIFLRILPFSITRLACRHYKYPVLLLFHFACISLRFCSTSEQSYSAQGIGNFPQEKLPLFPSSLDSMTGVSLTTSTIIFQFSLFYLRFYLTHLFLVLYNFFSQLQTIISFQYNSPPPPQSSSIISYFSTWLSSLMSFGLNFR